MSRRAVLPADGNVWRDARRAARAEHALSYTPANGLGAYWSCSCGATAGRRLIPPTQLQSEAAGARHVENAARRIVAAGQVSR